MLQILNGIKAEKKPLVAKVSVRLHMEEEFYTKGRRLNVKIICKRCGAKVEKEMDSELKKEYSYYCPECDENLFAFECEEIKE